MPFKKNDPNINRKGRPHTPKKFAEFRKWLSEQYLNENVPDGKEVKERLRKLMDDMSITRGERASILEYPFGKVPSTLAVQANVGNAKVNLYIPDNHRGAEHDAEPIDDADVYLPVENNPQNLADLQALARSIALEKPAANKSKSAMQARIRKHTRSTPARKTHNKTRNKKKEI